MHWTRTITVSTLMATAFLVAGCASTSPEPLPEWTQNKDTGRQGGHYVAIGHARPDSASWNEARDAAIADAQRLYLTQAGVHVTSRMREQLHADGEEFTQRLSSASQEVGAGLIEGMDIVDTHVRKTEGGGHEAWAWTRLPYESMVSLRAQASELHEALSTEFLMRDALDDRHVRVEAEGSYIKYDHNSWEVTEHRAKQAAINNAAEKLAHHFGSSQIEVQSTTEGNNTTTKTSRNTSATIEIDVEDSWSWREGQRAHYGVQITGRTSTKER